LHIIYYGLQQNMNALLTQTISAWVLLGMAHARWLTSLAARNGEGDDTIWVQMLVVVILAVAFGVFWLAKAKANKSSSSKEEDLPVSLQRWRIERQVGKTFENLPKKRVRDLQSGMELLEQDFLLSIVENTNDGNDEKDIIMRKLNFKELQRRGELNHADSKALRTYAINKGNIYGKDIQCEAMKSLAERTAKGKKGEK
jgi:hypothetical protein